jgi:hypothetical protein
MKIEEEGEEEGGVSLSNVKANLETEEMAAKAGVAKKARQLGGENQYENNLSAMSK